MPSKFTVRFTTITAAAVAATAINVCAQEYPSKAVRLIVLVMSNYHIRSGRLLPLGISSAKRSSVLPDIPTVAEAGLPGFDYTITTPS